MPSNSPMPRLTDYSSYADAQRHCSKDALWALFDGNRQALNIAHECVDRHVGRDEGNGDDGIAIRVAHADGRDELISFAALSDISARVAGHLQARGIRAGERVGIMLEPSLAF